ncbi:MAG: ketoacyl-ACP synthase III [Candidatus Omnitrophica bacterium]|nr:ketoacyl-ACP synthase III [Candidatus Omnitrophota bacterium]
MKCAKIAGLGKCLPSKILTNADLEKMVDTTDEWITTRTGIKERRIVDKGVAASHLGVEASKIALERAGISPSIIDLIIVTTITPDTQFPSTACYIQEALGASRAACFDLSAACSGFVYGLTTAVQFVKTGLYKNVLVVSSEVLSAITDWQDRSTCVLFGDGAGAAVITEGDQDSVLGVYMGSDGSETEVLSLPAGGSRIPTSQYSLDNRLHYMKMQGNELFRIAVRVMVDAAKRALKKAAVNVADISLLIPHQANERIITAVAKRLRIPQDKVYMNISRYGNMSSASTIVAFCEAWEEGLIKSGDIVVLDTFGGGLVWASAVIKWL